MSGLIALLDDVAAIAKVAAASVDDIAGQAAKVGAKTAGVLIDDAAVTPRYLHGFKADRELPIIWRIAKGSLKNKLVILLPGLLALAAFAPFVITPLLMLGGAYLCFEGAEKVFHVLFPHGSEAVSADLDPKDPAHLEEEKIAGAIKTDFILSAEIMTIALAALPDQGFLLGAVTLAVVGAMVTAAVYGAVALIVKMDDIGLHMATHAFTGAGRAAGRGLVKGMPKLMTLLSTVGTLAMLWVGGNILVHGLHDLGWLWLYDQVHHMAELAAQTVPQLPGLAGWLATATLDGIFGLAVGLLLIPVVTKVIGPLLARITGKPAAGH